MNNAMTYEMSTVEKTIQMNALLADGEFQREFDAVDSIEEFQVAFASHGIELSEDEVLEICQDTINAHKGSGELSENDLDEVSGGGVVSICVCALVVGAVYICSRIVRYIIKK